MTIATEQATNWHQTGAEFAQERIAQDKQGTIANWLVWGDVESWGASPEEVTTLDAESLASLEQGYASVMQQNGAVWGT